MPLPDPGTRSPGKLVVYYNTDGLEHQSSAWFKQPNDFSDVASIRSEAEDFATALMAYCTTTSTAHDWAITDPTGVQLYTEPFGTPIDGQVALGGSDIPAQSVSLSTIGKGVPPSIGNAFGNTRTFVFPGHYNTTSWAGTILTPTDADYVSDLRDFLDGSLIVGADFFGQGAEYGLNYNVQVNAHYQKTQGI